MRGKLHETVVHNRTDMGVRIKEEYGDVNRIQITLIPPGKKYTLMNDPDATYILYWFEAEGNRKFRISSDDCVEWESINILPVGDDATKFEWKGFIPRRDFEFPTGWNLGSIPRKDLEVPTAWKNASRKMDDVANFSVELRKDLERVFIYRAQCANLVTYCSERLQRIKKTFSLVSGHQMRRLYISRKLPQLPISLDNLLRALLSAQKLLKGCGQKEWRRTALVLSLPPPDPQNLEKFSGSKFALVIRELGWRFDLVQYALVDDGTTDFKWDYGRDRYVLQGNQPEDEVTDDKKKLLEGDRDREILDHTENGFANNEMDLLEGDRDRDRKIRDHIENGFANDEIMELLEGDRDREIRDHKELISDLKKVPLLKDDFYISMAERLWYKCIYPLAGWFWHSFFTSSAGWFWYNFFISSMAGWFWDNLFISSMAKWFWDNLFISFARWNWYIFYVILAGWLWYTVPPGNSAAPIQNWCLAGWPWYNSSHQKFAETIQNRCRKLDFDLDHLDLRKKKIIGKGNFKEVHKGRWLGLEVAIATFLEAQDGFTPYTLRRTVDAECEGIFKELRKEVGFMVTLHHPNVVDFFGSAIQIKQRNVVDFFFRNAIQKNKRIGFLVMELMEDDLGHLIKRNMNLQQTRRSDFGGPFSLSVTVDILMQIVEAMIHSHKHHVMHRDLKPGNCLVSKKATSRSNMDVHYTVKVIDFGNSRLWDLESRNNTYPSGTSHYMAPEARDSGDYTYFVDIYSFGMLCFEVITGTEPLDSPPFNRWRANQNSVRLRRGERPVIPANCPGSLSNLIRKCWAATPTDRPTFKAIQRDLWDYRLLLEAQYVL